MMPRSFFISTHRTYFIFLNFRSIVTKQTYKGGNNLPFWLSSPLSTVAVIKELLFLTTTRYLPLELTEFVPSVYVVLSIIFFCCQSCWDMTWALQALFLFYFHQHDHIPWTFNIGSSSCNLLPYTGPKYLLAMQIFSFYFANHMT